MKIIIIDSKNHWKNGWVSSNTDLQSLIKSFERNDFLVETFEVNSLHSLKRVLDNIDKNSLILPNAYYVDKEEDSNETVWMVDIIEAYGLPFIGSNSKTLQNVLQKDICQSILKSHNIPVPKFITVSQSNVQNTENILDSSNLTYPLIIKLTAESGSMGMDEKSLVQNKREAIAQIKTMIQKYQGNVIVEEFLPSNDLTIGYLQNKDGDPKLLTTWYLVEGKPGTTSIMGHKERFMPWSDIKTMPVVEDENILNQVRDLIPKVCEILNIKDVTRIDGRLDKNGKLKIFDVNGFPALCFPESVGVQQVISCFPDYGKEHIFDILINTIILSAANRYDITVPKSVQMNNFFMMENYVEL